MSGVGRFITFEGLDGAGKSTQIAELAEWLRARGVEPVLTREPGGTPIGEVIRELVLHRPMAVDTETLMIFAARAEHLAQVVRPALAAGRWVLCDRFTDATYAYQCGGRGATEDAVATLERWVHGDLQPDITFLFDVSPTVAARRRGAARAADRFEAEQIAFFERVRASYLDRARRHAARFVTIDAGGEFAQVRAQMLAACGRWLP